MRADSAFRSAGSSVVQVLVSTATLIVLYRFLLGVLGTRDFGIWAIVMAATSLVGLSNMGLGGSIVKHVAAGHAAGEPGRVAGLVETSVVSIAVAAVVFSLAGYPLFMLYLHVALDAAAQQKAVVILPWALLAFCLSMVASIYQSALYGSSQIAQRNGLLIFDSVAYLGLSLWLAPAHGLAGLVAARVLQNALTLALSAWAVKRREPALALLLPRWRRRYFRELIGYAMSFQFVTVLSMVMDPLTKGMLSRFGSLDLVAYFEMGSRLVGQVRGLIVNANQVLVPSFSQAAIGDSARVHGLFARSCRVMYFVAVCLFSALAAALPLIGHYWLHGDPPLFIEMGLWLCAGWGLNTLAVPAYVACLGTGAMREVVQSHLLMAVLNVVLGILLGLRWGGMGVVVAWVLTLAAGGAYIHVAFMVRNHFRPAGLLPPGSGLLLLACVAGVTAGYAMRFVAGGQFAPASSALLVLLAFTALACLPAWANPVRRDLAARVARALGGGGALHAAGGRS